MKGYEKVSRTSLLRRTPVIIRLDGKAFHTYTSKMPRPFYLPLHECMVESTKYLCEEVDTCVLGYTQSDEISLLLKDWTKFKTQSWFDSQVQKIVSTTASLVTAIFNDLAPKHIEPQYRRNKFAFFDSRVFNLPVDEVCNYFVWRQQDATRNSINSAGQALFSQKELHGKNVSEVQSMLLTEKNVNWNDYFTWAKRGTCVRQDVNKNNLAALKNGEDVKYPNGKLITDWDIPIFTKDRDYINDLMYQVQE